MKLTTRLVVGGLPRERIKIAQKIIQPYFDQPIDLDRPPADLLVLKSEDSIGISQIRSLKRFLSRRPYQAKIKIGLILEAEKLTLPAQNSFLKTLEEPPANSLIILLAPQKGAILPTIISRCQITPLPQKSQIEISEKLLASHLSLLTSILTAGVGERLKLSLSLVKNKNQALVLTENLLYLWRQILLAKSGAENRNFNFLSKLSLEQIERAIKNTEQVRKMLIANVNFHLAIENLFLSYPKFQDSPGFPCIRV